MSARIAILGGTGFLGRHLVDAAAARAQAVACGSRGVEARGASSPGVDVLRGDLARPQELIAELERWRPTLVVLAAAMARGGDCERDPDAALAVNARGPARVAAWCRSAGSRLVHVSTDLVFGAHGPRGGGFEESDPPSPLGAYGESKAAGERAVLEAEPSALVVRLPLLYGDSRGHAAGATDALVAALERGEDVVLFTDEWRTPLEVGDAARALVELGLGEASGLLHLAGPDRVSRAELGLRALEALGSKLPRPRLAPRSESGMDASRAADTSLAVGRARELLSTPPLGLSDGLAAWVAARRRGPRDPRSA
jgi:dTDP-4-dehydrorhamnose reductase